MSPRAGFDAWGNEAHGIPISGTGMAGLPATILLPCVRNATPEEIRGIKSGTRPDLVEAIREYERTLAAYNAELDAAFKVRAEEKARRSDSYWARRIAKHPEAAKEREQRRIRREARRTASAQNHARREAARIGRGEIAAPGETWWEIVADPVKYEAALQGAYSKPKQLRLEVSP